MIVLKWNFQAAASMMSPPMSPARKNAKDPDKPKVIILDLPWKKPFCPLLMPKTKRTFLVVEFIHCTFSLSPFTVFVFSFASLFLLLTLQAGQKLKVTGTVRVLNLDSLFLQFKLTFPSTLAAVLPLWVKSFFLPIFPFLLRHYHHHHLMVIPTLSPHS